MVTSFAEMLKPLEAERLTQWITEAMPSGLPTISTFAVGLNSDYDAVHAGLTTHWNPAPSKAPVNRIKLLKRRMLGRTSFALLCKRVLLA
ncbi:hypothetical protein [Streptomyces coeruleoprunus]|uniref:hypothetical protein n=1 Tax=Streptomyces coeruleoprunus TaxID=285563 RepID=UPI0031EF2D92